jgi:hypothetical protein
MSPSPTVRIAAHKTAFALQGLVYLFGEPVLSGLRLKVILASEYQVKETRNFEARRSVFTQECLRELASIQTDFVKVLLYTVAVRKPEIPLILHCEF